MNKHILTLGTISFCSLMLQAAEDYIGENRMEARKAAIAKRDHEEYARSYAPAPAVEAPKKVLRKRAPRRKEQEVRQEMREERAMQQVPEPTVTPVTLTYGGEKASC